jgi:hypothetical protein
LISLSRSTMSSGAIERHLCRLTSSIILLMRWLRCFMSVSFAIVIMQPKCSTSFSLSLSNLHPPSLKQEECHTNYLFVQFLF